jgi:3-methyladenine DNA glycosylase/8-oxoguanine DNA glycosylase
MPDFVKNRRGLRMPLLPTGFDALCWGIIGQQINVKFAASLRAGDGGTGRRQDRRYARPIPRRSRSPDIDIAALTARRLFPSKARYLMSVRRKRVAAASSDIENLGEGSAIAAGKGADGANTASAPGRRAMC